MDVLGRKFAYIEVHAWDCYANKGRAAQRAYLTHYKLKNRVDRVNFTTPLVSLFSAKTMCTITGTTIDVLSRAQKHRAMLIRQ